MTHRTAAILAVLVLAGCGTAANRAASLATVAPTALHMVWSGHGMATKEPPALLPLRGLWNWRLTTTKDCLVTVHLVGTDVWKLGSSPEFAFGGIFNLPAGTYTVAPTDVSRFNEAGAAISGADKCVWSVDMASPQ